MRHEHTPASDAKQSGSSWGLSQLKSTMLAMVIDDSTLAWDASPKRLTLLRRANSFGGEQRHARNRDRRQIVEKKLSLSPPSHNASVYDSGDDDDRISSPPAEWIAYGAPRVPYSTPEGSPLPLRRWEAVDDLARATTHTKNDDCSGSRDTRLSGTLATGVWHAPSPLLSPSRVSSSTVNSLYEDEADHTHPVGDAGPASPAPQNVMTWEEAFRRADARRVSRAEAVARDGLESGGDHGSSHAAVTAVEVPRSIDTNSDEDDGDDDVVSTTRSVWKTLCTSCMPSLSRHGRGTADHAGWSDAERSLRRLERLRRKTRCGRRRYEDEEEIPLFADS